MRALNIKIRIYSKQRKYPPIILAYKKLKKLSHNKNLQKKASFMQAWYTYRAKNYKQAARLFKIHISQFETNKPLESARFYLGWNYYLSKQYTNAKKTFLQIIKSSNHENNVTRASFWLSHTYKKQKKYSLYKKTLKSIIKKWPMSYYALSAAQELNLRKNIKKENKTTCNLAFAQQNFFYTLSKSSLSLKNLKTKTKKQISHLFILNQIQALKFILSKNNVNKAQMAIFLFHLSAHHQSFKLAPKEINLTTPTLSLNNALNYPLAYFNLLLQNTKRFSLSPLLILALIKQESAFKTQAHSWANANGLMQLIPPTAKRIHQIIYAQLPFFVSHLKRPNYNIELGSFYLNKLMHNFNNNIFLALASYNAGPHNTLIWLNDFKTNHIFTFVELIPFKETRNYIKKVLKNYHIYTQLYCKKPLILKTSKKTLYELDISF